MAFPSYKNWANVPSLGFDIHQNLIASGIGDGTIQIFDFKTGEQLTLGEGRAVAWSGGPPRCLRFQDDDGKVMGEEGLRLLYSCGRRVNELAWALD